MCTLEVSTAQDFAGVDVVVIKNHEREEVARVEALSPQHARMMARDCAMLIVRTGIAAAVVLEQART